MYFSFSQYEWTEFFLEDHEYIKFSFESYYNTDSSSVDFQHKNDTSFVTVSFFSHPIYDSITVDTSYYYFDIAYDKTEFYEDAKSIYITTSCLPCNKYLTYTLVSETPSERWVERNNKIFSTRSLITTIDSDGNKTLYYKQIETYKEGILISLVPTDKKSWKSFKKQLKREGYL